MNLAVKLYSEVDENPKNIPGTWPAEVRELGDGTDLPQGFSRLMTDAELEAYKATVQSDYDAWEALQPDPLAELMAAQKAYLASL